MLSIDKDTFNTNLRLTQKYCELQKANTTKNHASIFRSFNPQVMGEDIFKFTLSCYALEESKFIFVTEWITDPCKRANEYLIDHLFAKQLAHKQRVVTQDMVDSKFAGDILVVEADNTIIDGASAVSSYGIIDDYDLPPIDTWFYQLQSKEGRLLFAWIPREFVGFANDAVLVNAVDCINWFKDRYPDENTELSFSSK